MNKLDKNKTVHFIGIGGISMSSLANILLSKGYRVSGSDNKESELTDELVRLGASITIGQSASNITPDIGLVVYTAAIKEDNPEMQRVKELNIPAVSRAEFLGQLMKDYDNAICISGTHGKTTTTSLISQIFIDADEDPTILSGGIMPAIGGNIRIGGQTNLIAEACEYTNSFLSFFPKIAVILNVRPDHLDFFKDIDDIRSSFRKFSRLLPSDGTLVINGEIDDPDFFTGDIGCNVVTFGIDGEFDFTASDIRYDKFACPSFTVLKNGSPIGTAALNIPGLHNVSNSLAALAVADACNIDLKKALVSIGRFTGVDRRFQLKGKLGDVTIIDDYAHHPDEIKATLAAAKNYPHNRLWVVFQPHTYSRTIALMDSFADSLQAADIVVLPDIYAAREKNEFGITSGDLQKKIESLGTESFYIPTFDEIENFLLQNISHGDLLITMGAGDVVNIGNSLLGL